MSEELWDNNYRWNKQSRKNRNENSELKGKIKFERIKNNLDEFEINELEAKVNAEIELLEKKERKERNITKEVKKSILEVKEMEMI